MWVPPHWTAEQASLFTDFLGDVVQAVWDEHDHAIVDLIVEHGRISGDCRCRVCRTSEPDEGDDCYDPADDVEMEDDIPF